MEMTTKEKEGKSLRSFCRLLRTKRKEYPREEFNLPVDALVEKRNWIPFFFFRGTVPPRFLLCKDKCFMIIKTRNKEKKIWICNRVVHIYIVLNPWKVSPSSPISICKFIDTVSVSKAHRYKLFSVVKILYFLSQPKFIELTFRKVASLSLAKRLIYRKDYNASNSHCFD